VLGGGITGSEGGVDLNDEEVNMVDRIVRLGMLALVAIAFGLAGRVGFGDGVMFSRVLVGKAANLVSSPKQEAVLIPDGEKVTVILRTHFLRGPDEVAWLVPVPEMPTHIGQRSDDIFGKLDAMTSPRFLLEEYHGGFSFGCSLAAPTRVPLMAGVRHEASGTAGMIQYDVLSASSAKNLTAWLATNQYATPAGIEDSLDPYIAKGFHFLAMRLRPEASTAETQAPRAISYCYAAPSMGPPADWRRPRGLVYPLIISRASAAPLNEVVLYVLGEGRYVCSNWANVTLDDIHVTLDPGAASGTTYERQLRALATSNVHTFVTEFAHDMENVGMRPLRAELWSEDGDSRFPYWATYLVRMRALIAPSSMDRDVVLVPSFDPRPGRDIENYRYVEEASQASSLGGALRLVSGTLAVVGYAALRRTWRNRRSRLANGLRFGCLVMAMVLLTLF
jgi:hypothetical protein